MESISADPREPYEAPTIEDVPLRPEEMVLAGCKTIRGPAAKNQFVACTVGNSCKQLVLS
jgi:hypothetical protein